MKRLVLLTIVVLLFVGCGVGVYSVSSGKADVAMLSFAAQKKQAIIVDVDGKQYQIETVKFKAYKTDRKIKETAMNSIRLQAGQHEVTVIDKDGNSIFEKTIILSASEHRIIEL